MNGKALRLFTLFLVGLVVAVIVLVSMSPSKVDSRKLLNPPGEDPEKVHSNSGVTADGGRYYDGSGGYGYVLASMYADQMTGASLSVLSLQCWASSVSDKLRVVEPFVLSKTSNFGVVLDGHFNSVTQRRRRNRQQASMVRFRDVFDLGAWEREAGLRNYVPLVGWEEFTNGTPKTLITVSRKCIGGCSFDRLVPSFAERYSFNIVRRVVYKTKMYLAEEFRNMVYGGIDPHKAVVLFNEWGGINSVLKNRRLFISDLNRCDRKSSMPLQIQSSPSIIHDSQRYIRQYMPEALVRNGSSNSTKYRYISVMLRTERFALAHRFSQISSDKTKLSMFSRCVDGITTFVSRLKRRHSIKSVFLAMDCRKQGSKGLMKPSGLKEVVNTISSMLFHKLYGNSSTLEEWDESFDNAAHYKIPGYLAQLQKHLATSGMCLLTAGGGSFQESAMMLYEMRHKSSEDVRCGYVIPEC